MDLALRMVGFEAIPADSEIYVPGDNIRKVLFGIDIGSAELLMAKDQGYDVVISHHPVGGRARLQAWKVFELLIEPLWLQPEDGCSFLFLPLCAIREAFSAPSA